MAANRWRSSTRQLKPRRFTLSNQYIIILCGQLWPQRVVLREGCAQGSWHWRQGFLLKKQKVEANDETMLMNSCLRSRTSGLRDVEESNGVHGSQDAENHVIDTRLGNRSVINGIKKSITEERVIGHLHVQSAKSWLNGTVSCSPIWHHETTCIVLGYEIVQWAHIEEHKWEIPLEAHASLEVGVKSLVVLAGVGVVDLVVRAHDRSDSGVDGSLEGWIIDLPLSSLWYCW